MYRQRRPGKRREPARRVPPRVAARFAVSPPVTLCLQASALRVDAAAPCAPAIAFKEIA